MMQFTPEVPKAPSEGLCLHMDFSRPGWLVSGETIQTCTWSCQVYRGVDPNPGAMISGPATINGAVVFQDVVGGQEGVVYVFLATVTTNTGRTLVGRGLLLVGTV